jgi:hypothetical protein
MFRISLDVECCRALEHAAAVRGLDPDVLLNAIERLVDDVLDDLPTPS